MNGDQSVDSYINQQPEEVRERLAAIRSLIIECAPEVQEGFAYGMPAYRLNKKPLLYFAAFKNHIGLYALPTAHAHFAKQFAKYKQGKGSVQLPLDEPLPYELIKSVLLFRLKELNT
jgi:Uncharacterized conserved protein